MVQPWTMGTLDFPDANFFFSWPHPQQCWGNAGSFTYGARSGIEPLPPQQFESLQSYSEPIGPQQELPIR